MSPAPRIAPLLAVALALAVPALAVETRKPSELKNGTTPSTTNLEARRASEMINGTPRPEAGDWLLEPYIDALDKLYYWEEAGEEFKGVFARVSEDPDSSISVCYGTWRETLGCLWMPPGGQFDARDPVEGGFQITIPDHRRLVLSYGQDRDLSFKYVGDVRTWVAHKVLGGEYKDPNGRRFSFNADGDAIFAGRQVSYSMPVGDDGSYPPHTLIIAGKPHRYEFDGKRLKVWEILDDPAIAAPAEPALNLRLIVPADAVVLPRKNPPKK